MKKSSRPLQATRRIRTRMARSQGKTRMAHKDPEKTARKGVPFPRRTEGCKAAVTSSLKIAQHTRSNINVTKRGGALKERN